MENIFNFDASEMPVVNQQSGGQPMFNPKPDGNNSYVVQLRMVPNLLNPLLSIVFKQGYWLEDTPGQGFNYDSPTTNKEFCPVSNRYWALKNDTMNAQAQALANGLRLQKRYTAFVQIVKDSNNADHVGKVLPWRIPVDVYKKIDAWIKPDEKELAAGKTAKPIFNLGKGFNLILTVVNKLVDGQQMRDYSVELADEATPIVFNGQALQATPESQQAFIAYLEEQALPNLVETYGYHEADLTLKTRVKRVLASKYGDPADYWPEAVINTATAFAPVEQVAPAQNAQPAAPAAPAAPAGPAQAAGPAPTQQAEPAQNAQAAPAQNAEVAPATQAAQATDSQVDDIAKDILGS